MSGSRPPAALALALALLFAGARAAFAEAQLVSVTTATGQADYRVAKWTTADGLPQSTVTDVAVMPDGVVWLATFGGLVRFDGRRFEVLDMAADEGLPANRIVSLKAAGPETFLFLTQHGHLGRVADGRAQLLVPPPAAPVEMLELLVDPGGRFYCKSVDGKVWTSDGQRSWEPVAGPGANGWLHDFAVDETGDTWGTWGDQLVEMTGGVIGRAVPLREPKVILSRRIGGGLWLGRAGAVGRWASGRLDRLDVRPELVGKVSAIEPVDDTALWLATDGKLSRLDRLPDGSWWQTRLPEPGTGVVRALRLDGQGNLWIGAKGSGLYRVSRLPVRRVSAASGLGEVGALAGDGAGGAFAASDCGRLFHVTAAGAVSEVRLPPPADPRLHLPCGLSLAPGPAGRVWARRGSDLHLVGREPLTARLVTADLPRDEGPLVAGADGAVWVMSRDGTGQLRSAAGRVLRELRLPTQLLSAAAGPDGALWIGGDGLVFRVDGDAIERFGPSEGVPRGLVRDVLAEADGTAWIGSYGGGMGRLRAGRIVSFTAEQGLPDNSISTILADGRGRLWIATNRGVAVVEKRELEAVADGRAAHANPVVFGAERGVAEANFGRPAGFADGNGRLWFGTIEGAVSIDAAAFPFNRAPPVVRVAEVTAEDRPLPLGPIVRLPALTARVRLSFAVVAPLYPERTSYRFRVEGLDAGWVDAGAENTVDWSPPGPGRHRFLVEARNEDGVWSRAPTVIELDVQPAWWQASAPRAALALALALAGVFAVRLRIRGIERRHGERLRVLEEQRAAEASAAALRAQLEHATRAALAGELAASLAHEVRQPLGAIVNNAEAGRRNLERYLQQPSELAHLLDDIVADGRRASEVVEGLRSFLHPADAAGAASVRAEQLDLSELVREMLPLVRRELRDLRAQVDVELSDRLPRVEGLRVQLGQIVVNLVLNACEALAGKDGERRITISTAAPDGRVELVVADNGPGLAAEVAARLFEPFVTTKAGGLGLGLAVCRSIAERHGGRLVASAAPSGGVRATLTLPPARPEAAS